MSTPEQLTIDTPEQISLQFSLASIGSRFLALGIDTSFQAAGFFFLIVLAQIVNISSSLRLALLRPWGFAVLLLAAFVIYYGYFAIFEVWWGGQTPGKRLIGLRVIAVSGRPITPFEAILRNLVRIADQLPGIYAIGILSVFLSSKHQRLGDFAAGTVVVHERPLEAVAAPETPAVRIRYGANGLGADEIVVIDAFLRRRDDLPPQRRDRAAAAIASRIRQRLNVGATDGDERFLEDIVAEYPVDERLSLMTGWQRSATAHSLHTFDVALRTRGRGTWRTFSDPIAIFQALEPDDVPGCLTAIDRAVEGGGYAAGFLAYEAAAAFGLSTHRRRAGFLPLVCFGIYPPEHVMSVTRPAPREPYRLDEWRPSMRPEAYASAIRRIESREVPQAVLTLRLHAAFEGEPRTLMADLDAARGGWMSAFIDAGTHAICSASPELLFAIEGRTVECRPVSGRYPRGLSSTADRRHSDWLRDSEASRAEHAAIADAVRAALERVADAGTVEWRSRFEIERSPLFWQMASTVSGRVRRPTLAHLVAALFPSAAVTGVPKDRAMEAITEVESTSRGAQTGAIGYLSPRGRGRLSVAHQSVVIDREQRDAEIGIERTVSPAGRALDEYAVSLAEAAMLFPSSPGGRDQAGVVRIVSYVTAPRPDVRLLETIKWTPADGFVLLDRHVARLGESAACFGFECDLVEVRRVLAAAVEDLKAPAKVRILLSRDGAIACEAIDLAEEDPGPLRVAFARDPIDARDVFLYHQTTRRAVYDRARASRPDADAVLLWNVDGEVTEATGWNVVVQVNGRNITPPVDAGLLPGTLRAELLALGELVEQRITRDELRRAERIWLINSLRGWVEVLMVD